MQTVDRLKSERPRKKYDFYETPPELARAALEALSNYNKFYSYCPSDVLDAGAGMGVWGRCVKKVWGDESIFITGAEIEEKLGMPGYDEWYFGDYLDYPENIGMGPCLIVGNPPYSLAEEFVRKSLSLVDSYNGYVFFLLRLAFLESKKRYFGLFKEHPPMKVWVLSRRPSFFTTKEGRKTTDALSYAMFLWKKGWEGTTELDWLYWEYDK